MKRILVYLCVGVVSLCGVADAEEKKPAEEICVVSGKALSGSAVTVTHDGQELRLCCEKCQAKFEKDPAKYLQQLALMTYPLETCVVSGEKLGSMGKPVMHTHEGNVVMFCCKRCTKSFSKDPEKYLKKISDAKGDQ